MWWRLCGVAVCLLALGDVFACWLWVSWLLWWVPGFWVLFSRAFGIDLALGLCFSFGLGLCAVVYGCCWVVGCVRCVLCVDGFGFPGNCGWFPGFSFLCVGITQFCGVVVLGLEFGYGLRWFPGFRVLAVVSGFSGFRAATFRVLGWGGVGVSRRDFAGVSVIGAGLGVN